jgi:type I restriction enzyme S subunit
MIEGLQPYSGYRDSTAPWFGDVPSHWEVKRLGSLFAERGETNERREVSEILSVLKDRGVIPYAEKGRIGNKASDDIGRYKIVRPDDLVLNCMNVIIGSLGCSRYTGCLSPVYYVLRRRDSNNDPRYLALVFQHRPFHQSLIRIGNGILAHRMRIPMEKLKAEMLPLPPPDEQAAIVRFLDHANRKIDGFIRAKRKLIGLLNEQKQAIIHRAVTRGLNPDAPLKPSGIPWLGDIPAHWEIGPAKHFIYSDSRGGAPIKNTASEIPLEGWYPAFSASGQDVWLPTHCYEGDGIVLSAVGARCGKTFLAHGKWSVVANTHVIRLRPKQLARFWWYVTNNANWWEKEGAAQPFVRVSPSLRRVLSVPPPDEQTQIVDWLDERLNLQNNVIAHTEREIALMQEYRTRLTADVVTGKLDVRAAAAKLPDIEDEKEVEPDETEETELEEATQ